MKLYVYNDYDKIIGVVSDNNLLENGAMYPSYHKGITKLQTGEYVLIDSDGENYRAHTVDDETAFQAILEAGREDLLTVPKFASLNRFCKGLSREI